MELGKDGAEQGGQILPCHPQHSLQSQHPEVKPPEIGADTVLGGPGIWGDTGQGSEVSGVKEEGGIGEAHVGFGGFSLTGSRLLGIATG